MSDDLPVESELFPGDTRRDQQDLMTHPFAALTKSQEKINYYHELSSGKVIDVEVTAGEDGMATIHDFDVLLYCISVIRETMNQGEDPPRTVTFKPRQLLRWSNRSTGGRGYESLYKALERLSETQTNALIKEDGGRVEGKTPWITYQIKGHENERGLYENDRVTVRIAGWLRSLVIQDELLLAIDEEYFQLQSGYKRFLYRVFRRSVGRGDYWSWKMNHLYKKAGTSTNPRKFAYQIRKIIKEDGALPRYKLSVLRENQNDPDTEWVRAYDQDFYERCMNGEEDLPPLPWEKKL